MDTGKISEIDFSKSDGLIPVIVQHFNTYQVLMLGYMNQEALMQTIHTNRVVFYSRSKKRLWQKGETSGNFLELVEIYTDCDKDSLLIMAKPLGPTCHTGTTSCFNNDTDKSFISGLENIIHSRLKEKNPESYTVKLFQRGINKIAQKVGEEAVELVIEAKDNNNELFLNEAADLMYHYLVLLHAKGFTLKDVERVLEDRHKG